MSVSGTLLHAGSLTFMASCFKGFWIFNNTNESVNVLISRWTGGSANWYPIQASSNDAWKRSGQEMVVFRSQDGSRTAGYYVNSGTKWCKINFSGFEKDPEFIPDVDG
ncbi:hypothetical protein BDQ17DRAFT_1353239 [Cyathus striatus]|nr:hypothetical protein BDQ17DRAFT_1353239 [Cyathus striatus]